MKREIQIVVETERKTEISRRSSALREWCEKCDSYMRMLSLEAAAATADVTPYAIYRWIEADRFHHGGLDTGNPRICRTSFLQYLESVGITPVSHRKPDRDAGMTPSQRVPCESSD